MLDAHRLDKVRKLQPGNSCTRKGRPALRRIERSIPPFPQPQGMINDADACRLQGRGFLRPHLAGVGDQSAVLRNDLPHGFRKRAQTCPAVMLGGAQHYP